MRNNPQHTGWSPWLQVCKSLQPCHSATHAGSLGSAIHQIGNLHTSTGNYSPCTSNYIILLAPVLVLLNLIDITISEHNSSIDRCNEKHSLVQKELDTVQPHMNSVHTTLWMNVKSYSLNNCLWDWAFLLRSRAISSHVPGVDSSPQAVYHHGKDDTWQQEVIEQAPVALMTSHLNNKQTNKQTVMSEQDWYSRKHLYVKVAATGNTMHRDTTSFSLGMLHRVTSCSWNM